MKFTSTLCVIAIAITSFATADLTQYVNDLPSCGLKCILEILPSSVCGLTNQSCICTNTNVSAATSLCLTQNCTVIERLQVANISELSCGRSPPSRQSYLISTVAFEGIVLVAGGLRLFIRESLVGSLMADDYLMIAALVLSIPFACIGVLAAVYGFGKNIWDIKPNDLTFALKLFFIDQTLYIVILALCKFSILTFYLRIFPSRNFRLICTSLAGCTALYTIVFIFLGIFQCIPVSYNWEGWKGESEGKCENLSARAYASAAINFTLDFAVLLLPVPWLVKLRVSLKKKINVILMFSVGVFICITSVIRFTKLIELKATTNPTWDYVDTTYWTAIEVYVSLIVPCLPAIRSLLSHRCPWIFGDDSQDRNRSNYERSQANGGSFIMSSKTPRANTASTDHGSFLRELSLGDQSRGTVSTGVTTGSRTSEDQLVETQGISVSTNTQIIQSPQTIHNEEIVGRASQDNAFNK